MNNTFVIVGLGNPGSKYVNTRHNVGFDVISILSQRHNIPLKKLKHKALIGEGKINGVKVVLAQPQTFMNSSGECVVELVNWYKIPLSNLIIIYDDIDIDFAKLRIRPGGSAGSHNGMKSVISLLGEDKFPRIRIGIGQKPPYMDLVNYVLGKYPKEQQQQIYDGMCNAADSIESIISDGLDNAMNKFNGK